MAKTHLRIMKTAQGRYYIANSGGKAIPTPIVVSVCPRWAWQTNGTEVDGRTAWERFYGDRADAAGPRTSPLMLWVEEQGQLMLAAGINGVSQYVDPVISCQVPGLTGVHPIIVAKHVMEEWGAKGYTADAMVAIFDRHLDDFLANCDGWGVPADEHRAISAFNELPWQFRPTKKHTNGILPATDVVKLMSDVIPKCYAMVRERASRALIVTRVAGSLRKTWPDWKWGGKDRPSHKSHYWALVEIMMGGADVYGQNNYWSDLEKSDPFGMDEVSEFLEGKDLSGATAVTEFHHATLHPSDHNLRYMSFQMSPGFNYPIAGSEEEALEDYRKTMLYYIEKNKSVVLLGPYGWADHADDPKHPYGKPWRGGVDPYRSQSAKGGGLTEFRSATWVTGFRAIADEVRVRQLELLQQG